MNGHREYPETKKKPPKGSDVIEGIKGPQMAKGAIESEPRSKPEDYDRRAPPIMSLRPPKSLTVKECVKHDPAWIEDDYGTNWLVCKNCGETLKEEGEGGAG